MSVQQTASTHVMSFYCLIISKRCSATQRNVRCRRFERGSLQCSQLYTTRHQVLFDYWTVLTYSRYILIVTFGKARFRFFAANP
jgi:hypothetical protein